MPDYRWRPIEPLSDRDRSIDLAGMQPLYESWRASQKRLAASSPTALKEYTDRLIRRLSVETGILERLYDLDRGTTEALVAKGFAEDLISRSDTDVEPSRLVDILRDQEAAIQLAVDAVARNRELSKGFIHELHAILTRHQDTTTAVDPSGRRREIPLLKGKFKESPNNPRRPDGSIHEYCPPLHVESEMDRLLGRLEEYSGDDPLLVASWFHHRFAQIHPYQDGNGRLARALTTLLLIRVELLPLVIDRDLRVEYLTALEHADGGELKGLVHLFAREERGAILQALSVDVEAEISHQRTLTAAVIEHLSEKFGKRRSAQTNTLREANAVACALRTQTEEALAKSMGDFAQALRSVAPATFLTKGGPDRGNGHWYKSQVIKTAREAGKFANLDEAHYFLKSSLQVAHDRLVFVVSFHHVGREISGIMEATAFAEFQSAEGPDRSAPEEFAPCAPEPFVFTHRTDPSDIRAAFARWLDAATAVAFKEFGDRL